MCVQNYLFWLQLKALFLNLVYFHGRALSSQPTPILHILQLVIYKVLPQEKPASSPLVLFFGTTIKCARHCVHHTVVFTFLWSKVINEWHKCFFPPFLGYVGMKKFSPFLFLGTQSPNFWYPKLGKDIRFWVSKNGTLNVRNRKLRPLFHANIRMLHPPKME